MLTQNLGRVTGKSAYEIAVDQGYVGTEKQWIRSFVKGEKGEDGKTGFVNGVAIESLFNDIALYVRDYKTDNNTWQDALQLALTYSHINGGGTVILPKKIIILCYKKGEKDTEINLTSNVKHSYCLEVGNETTIDLNQSIVKLADNQNASLFVTKTMKFSTQPNKNIAVYNGIIDMNGANQTAPTSSTADGITFFNLIGLKLNNLEYRNSRFSSFKLLAVKQFFIDNQFTTNSEGDAYRLGIYSVDSEQRCQDGTIGSLQAENCCINKVGNLQGNPIIASLKNVVLSQIIAKNCGGGYKFQDGCDNVTIGRSIFNGALTKDTFNSSVNSGLKIQGNGILPPTNITVGEAISTDCYGDGLYIEDFGNVSIGSYIGLRNAQIGTRSDIRVGKGNRFQIANISSELAGGTSIELRADLEDYQIGNINILNPANQVDASGFSNSAKNGTIQSLIIKDTRETKKMTYGFNVPTSPSMGTLQSLEVYGAKTAPFKLDSYLFEIKKVIMDNTMSTIGQVTLSTGITTTVLNGNSKAFNRGTIGFNVPIIELIPVNAKARELLTKQLTYTVSTINGFTIQHPTATGTELFIYKINGYILTPTNIS